MNCLGSSSFCFETFRLHWWISRSQSTINAPFAWGNLWLHQSCSFECSHWLYFHRCKKPRRLLTSALTNQCFVNFHRHHNNLGSLLKFLLLSSNPRGSASANLGGTGTHETLCWSQLALAQARWWCTCFLTLQPKIRSRENWQAKFFPAGISVTSLVSLW